MDLLSSVKNPVRGSLQEWLDITYRLISLFPMEMKEDRNVLKAPVNSYEPKVVVSAKELLKDARSVVFQSVICRGFIETLKAHNVIKKVLYTADYNLENMKIELLERCQKNRLQ